MNRKRPICLSIIQKLNHRTITGKELGLNVHRNSGRILHLSWNKRGKSGEYLNCIARKCCGLPLLLEILLPLRQKGLTSTCNCVYGTVPGTCERTIGICFYQFCFFCFCRCRVSFVIEMAKDDTYLLNNRDGLLELH